MLKEEKIALWTELGDKQAEKLTGGYQTVRDARILGMGSASGGIRFLNIDKNHDQTSATSSCQQKVFSWSDQENPNAYQIASRAQETGGTVTIDYSEYRCSPHAAYGANSPPFHLIEISTF